jgi:hypothetical protein
LLIFNIPGITMFLIAGAITLGVKRIPGFPVGQGPPTFLLGVLCIVFDLVYRLRNWKKYASHWALWIHPARGGALFLLPVWGFGLLWVVLGIIYTIGG